MLWEVSEPTIRLNLLQCNYISDSDINVISCSEDGNFVAVAEQNGCLHLIDSNTQKPFFSKVYRRNALDFHSKYLVDLKLSKYEFLFSLIYIRGLP